MHQIIASKYIKLNLIELQGEIDKSANNVNDSNISFWIVTKRNKEIIRKMIIDLNNTINQLIVYIIEHSLTNSRIPFFLIVKTHV